MRNVEVAVFTVPRPVHVYPLLSITEALARRGHRVTYVTSETFESQVSAVGADVLRCPRFVLPWDGGRNVDCSAPEDDGVVRSFVDLAKQTLKRVEPFCEKSRPDLILYDSFSFAGLIAAQKYGIPAVHITPQLIFDASKFEVEKDRSKFARGMLAFDKDLDALFRDCGVAVTNGVFRKELLNIYLYPKDFQIHDDSGERRAFYAPRCAAERPSTRSWRPSHSGNRPSALVSASTTFAQGPDYYLMCADVLSSLGWHVVLAIGDNNDIERFSHLSASCELSQGVPQVEIMPYVQMLVSLGGMATTMEAMYHGVPLLMLTHGFEEAQIYADNVARLGLGLHLPSGSATAQDLRRAAQELDASTEIRSRVRDMQLRVRRSPGAEEVANRVEEYLESSSRPVRSSTRTVVGD